ncbi:MAG: Coenzyme F420 hydrogenase/dehydrogenase, beta subunit C-terminal domain [Candidatus Wukongarchaeota archaeon]|nr:Coenzyme F420 hydrogenase/dehydrogenase, beta subunit C-terminal domain [Candidatus Wukongarchaeota archaeon]
MKNEGTMKEQKKKTRRKKDRPDYGVLDKLVISKGYCCGCGVCVGVCPVEVIGYEALPKLIGECISCGRCSDACPRGLGRINMEPQKEAIKDGLVGSYLNILAGKATKTEILEKAQDGGAVTSILCACLESGYIDGAIVTRMDPERPWKPVPMIATTKEEIISAAGTKYHYPFEFSVLKKATKELKLQSFSVVTRPCSTEGVRRLQQSRSKKSGKAIKLVVGLFCMEAFHTDFIDEVVAGGMELSLSNIKKINIKRDFVLTLDGGSLVDISMKKAEPYIRTGCRFCSDFASEMADVSAGAVGTKNGWTTLITRTDIGKEAVEIASNSGWLETREVSQKVLTTPHALAKRKKDRAIPILR